MVTAEGDYLGGAIAPGVEVSLEALTTRAAKLIKVEHRRARARHRQVDTIEALQSGAVYGFAGQVEGIVARDPRGARRARPGRSRPAAWPS